MSLLLLTATLLANPAQAGSVPGTVNAAVASSPLETLGRDLGGRRVSMGQGTAPQVLVFWSMRCVECLAPVRALQDAGVDVVLINSDAAGEAQMLRPFLVGHGIDAPVVADPTGSIRSRFHVRDGLSVVVLDENGVEVLRQLRGDTDVARLVSTARPMLEARTPQVADIARCGEIARE